MTRPRSRAGLERARADAVAVLRHALPTSARAELPARELAGVCERLRAELFGERSPYDAVRRAAGFVEPLPADDRGGVPRAAESINGLSAWAAFGSRERSASSGLPEMSSPPR